MKHILTLFILLSLLKGYSQNWDYSEVIATNNLEIGNSIAVDSVNQSIYVVGSFNDRSTFAFPPSTINGGEAIASGNKDGFLAKYDYNGNIQWAVPIGGGSDDELFDVSVGPSGNVFITGYISEDLTTPYRLYNANLSFTGATIASIGNEDLLVASYSSVGNLLWHRIQGGTESDKGHTIIATQNDLYVAGTYKNAASFSTFNTENTFNTVDNTFLTKYTPNNGTTQWLVEAKSNGNDALSSEIEKSGIELAYLQDTVYIIGHMGGSTMRFVDATGTILTSPILTDANPIGKDIFIYSVTNNGDINWAQKIDNKTDDQNYGMAIAADCHGIYIGGNVHDGAVFPSSYTVGNFSHDKAYLAKLNLHTGIDEWINEWEGSSNHSDIFHSITADGYGNIYSLGTFLSNPLVSPDITLSGASSQNIMIFKHLNTGDFIWGQQSTGTGNDFGYAIASDANQNIFITGEYSLSFQLGSIASPTSTFNQNLFLSKYTTSQSGSPLICCFPPTITNCKNDTTIVSSPSCTYNIVDFTTSINATNNCANGITTTQIPAPLTPLSTGVHTVLLIAEDGFGQKDTCSFNLTVEAPNVSKILNCGDYLTGETTIGQQDNENNFNCTGYNTPGEDVFYQITIPDGNHWLQISIDDVVDADDLSLETFWLGSNCPTTNTCLATNSYDIATQQFSTGGNSIQYLATGPATYYFVVDALNNGIDNYNIGIQCLESGIEFDNSISCGDPNNDGIIPKINNTLDLNVETCEQVQVCHELFAANTQDAEWLDSIYMDLGSCYTNIVPIDTIGFYQPGNWVSTYNNSQNTIGWQFNNTNNITWGDGSGTDYSCDSLKTRFYSFCFTADISPICIANSNLNVGVTIYDDGVAAVGSGLKIRSLDYVSSEDFIINNPPPSISCPANVSQNTEATLCGATINGIPPLTSNDNCPTFNINYNLTGATTGSGSNDASGTFFNIGITNVQYQITDALGLKDSCSFTVTIIDNENPTITCPSNQIANTDASLCTAVVNNIAPVSINDNCTIDSVGYTITGTTTGSGLNDASGTTFNTGTSTITYVIYDTTGNTSTCSFTVTIEDNENPTITVPTNVTTTINNGFCSATINNIAPVSFNDNCTMDSVNYIITGATTGSGLNDASGTTFNIGISTVTYTIHDTFGNSSSSSFTITVIDNINATITCLPTTFANTDINLCSATVTNIAPVSFNDNCAIDSVSYTITGATTGSGLNDASGTIFNIDTSIVTYTIHDISGNTNSCSFMVIVEDNESPTISCPSDLTFSPASTCSGIVNGLAPTVSDNCLLDSVSYTISGATTGLGLNDASGTTFNAGLSTVKYFAIDVAGNIDSCSFNVTIIDTVAPTISCPAAVTDFTDPGLCTVTINSIAPISFNDNCNVDSVGYAVAGATVNSGSNDASGTSFNAGFSTVTYYVYDFAGNVDSCSFTVTINDNENPTIICPSNTNATTDIGLCSATVTNIAPTSFNDNCTIDSVSYIISGATIGSGLNDASNSSFNTGISTVSYYIYDDSGNVDSCSFTVTVNDNENPTITCPDNITICTTTVAVAPPVVSDNCLVDSFFNSYNSTTDASDIYPIGVTDVTWTVTDANGNSNSCVMTVNIESPPISFAGNDQILFSTFSTSFEADTAINGSGSWSINAGYGNISNSSDPKSFVDNLEIGDNIFEWKVANSSCPESIDDVKITVVSLKVPNGFSPNDDGDNDLLVIEGVNIYENEITLFNRSGVEVFTAKNYQNDWDGKSKSGKDLANDTYFYTLTIPELNEELTGFIVLKR